MNYTRKENTHPERLARLNDTSLARLLDWYHRLSTAHQDNPRSRYHRLYYKVIGEMIRREEETTHSAPIRAILEPTRKDKTT